MKSVRLAGILIIALFIMLCYSSCNYKAGEVKPDTSKDSSLVSSGDPLLSCDDGIPAMRNSWNAGPAMKVVEEFEKKPGEISANKTRHPGSLYTISSLNEIKMKNKPKSHSK